MIQVLEAIGFLAILAVIFLLGMNWLFKKNKRITEREYSEFERDVWRRHIDQLRRSR